MGPEPRDALRVDVESFYESLDLLLATLVIGVVAVYAIHIFPVVTTKIRHVEPIILSVGDRVMAHEHFAVTGAWPSEAIRADETSDPKRISTLTRSVAFNEGGRLDYVLDQDRLSQGVLSFRPFTSSADSPASIVWLCADASEPPGFTSSTTDGTTIDDAFLASPCRHIRK